MNWIGSYPKIIIPR